VVPPIKKGVTVKKKWTVSYLNIPSAIRPVPHSERLPIPKSPEKKFSGDCAVDDENAKHHLRLHSEE
jgi:hypothetical protein